jgi:hypothetical protein
MRPRACVSGIAALAATLALCEAAAIPRHAAAAFELRDASPAALGAVSMDREPHGFFEDAGLRGLGLTASHASLYGVDGLTAEKACASFATSTIGVDLSHAQVGAPGVREHATCLTMREAGALPVALSIRAERLVLALEGEPRIGAWVLGAGVLGQAAIRGVRVEIGLAADRALRRGEPGLIAVQPSVPWTIRLHARGASLEFADRWEGNGRTSPRVSLDVRAGGALALRFGRGERPGRTGAAAALRAGRVEVAVGRQDDEHGGSVSSAAVTLLPGRPKP